MTQTAHAPAATRWLTGACVAMVLVLSAMDASAQTEERGDAKLEVSGLPPHPGRAGQLLRQPELRRAGRHHQRAHHGRADVRLVQDPGARHPALPHRVDPWRRPYRLGLRRDTRRPRRAGPTSSWPAGTRCTSLTRSRAAGRRTTRRSTGRTVPPAPPRISSGASRHRRTSTSGRRRTCTISGRGAAGSATRSSTSSSPPRSGGSRAIQEVLTRNGGAALLDKIGPAIILTHSQSGPHGWQIADARPNKVKGIVAVEPSGPPFYNVDQVGPPDWFELGPLARLWGITATRIHYDPAVTDPSQLSFVYQDAPDESDLVRCHLQAEPARQLPKLQGIPIVIIASGAGYHRSYDHCTVEVPRAGRRPEHATSRWTSAGIEGNGHMMMLEKNNLRIARADPQLAPESRRLRDRRPWSPSEKGRPRLEPGPVFPPAAQPRDRQPRPASAGSPATHGPGENQGANGTQRCRQAGQAAIGLAPAIGVRGWPLCPHAGHGPGTRGCQGLVHPHA